MKLNSIFERAVHLAGISDEYVKENDTSDLKARALTAINTVLFDLCETPPCEALGDEPDITAEAQNAAVYGTAMFLCLAFGDTSNANLFSKIYSAKRTAFKSGISAVSDRLPKTEAAT